MSRRKNGKGFEDDGRVIADMSGLGSSGPLDGKPSDGAGGELNVPPFSWRERLHYIGAALGAALLIGSAFIAGIGFVIWLITLYGLN